MLTTITTYSPEGNKRSQSTEEPEAGESDHFLESPSYPHPIDQNDMLYHFMNNNGYLWHFITLKYIRFDKFVHKPYYEAILDGFMKKGIVVDLVYEVDKYDRLHVHFIFATDQYVCFKNLVPRYCHLKFKKVCTEQYAKHLFIYMRKAQANDYAQQDFLFCHNARHRNIFQKRPTSTLCGSR